jgi:hypothetical protein
MPAETRKERDAQNFCYDIALSVLELKPGETYTLKLRNETLKLQRIE